MTDEFEGFLGQMEAALDDLLKGKPKNRRVDDDISTERCASIAKKMNKLTHDFAELRTMAIDLSEGKLDGFVPPRDNLLASPLKQLHSQLSILVWNMRELLAGKIVSKMDPTGELFFAFNDMVDKVAGASTTAGFAMEDDESMNSWRYHQILLAINLLHISVIEVDEQGGLAYVNLPARDMLGDVKRLRPDMATEYGDELLSNLALYSGGDHDYPIPRELYDTQKDAWYKVISDTFTLPDGSRFYLHMVDDITDWKKHESELQFTATMDILTGAYNRRPGLEKLTHLLNMVPSDATHCLAFIDIDDLKYVNDNYGHTEGDSYIKTVSSVLLSSVRASDTVVRYGGDEFFILFKECTMEVSSNIIDRMHEKLGKINEVSGKPYPMSFSHGVVDFHYNPAMDPKNLLSEADKRMYAHKESKKKPLSKDASYLV